MENLFIFTLTISIVYGSIFLPYDCTCPIGCDCGYSSPCPNGKCYSCRPAYYGTTDCSTLCSSDCDTGYSHNCARDTGVCYSCPPKRWGTNFCENLCSPDCDTGYTHNCARDTGVCYSCPPKRWGTDFCENLCSPDCDIGYTHNCARGTGVCYSCPPKRWGTNFCENLCSSYCDTGYSHNCARDTGACTACISNRWGQTCQYSCPQNCYSKSCQRSDGGCSRCKSGYNGVHCNNNSWYTKACTFTVDFLIKRALGYGECLPMGLAVGRQCLALTWEVPVIGTVFCSGMGIYFWRLCEQVGTQAIHQLIGNIEAKMCDPFWQYPNWDTPSYEKYLTPSNTLLTPPEWPKNFTTEYTTTFMQNVTSATSIYSESLSQNFMTNTTTLNGDKVLSRFVFKCALETIYTLTNGTCTYATGSGCKVADDYLDVWLKQQGFNSSLVFNSAVSCKVNGGQCNLWVSTVLLTNSTSSFFYYEDIVTRIPVLAEIYWGSTVVVQHLFTKFESSVTQQSVFTIPNTCKEAI